jgi:hypothetical protein
MSAHKLIPPLLREEIRLAEIYLQKSLHALHIENIPKEKLHEPILLVSASELKQAIGDTGMKQESFDTVLIAIIDMYEAIGGVVFRTQGDGLVFYLHDYQCGEHIHVEV